MSDRSKSVGLRLVFAISAALSSLAQTPAALAAEPSSDEGPSVAVVTSAVTPFFGAYYLEAEARVTKALALLFNTSALSLESGDWLVRAGTVGAGVDYYFGKNALRGWYAEAIAELWFSSWRHEPSRQVAPLVLGYAGVAIVGYQFVFDLGPVLDLGAGATAFYVPPAHLRATGVAGSSDSIFRVYPAAKVDLGWSF